MGEGKLAECVAFECGKSGDFIAFQFPSYRISALLDDEFYYSHLFSISRKTESNLLI